MKMSMFDLFLWFFPYGFVCWVHKCRYGVREEYPLLAFRGLAKRLRRVVKFAFPYGLVNYYRRSPHFQLARMKRLAEIKTIRDQSFPAGATDSSRVFAGAAGHGRTAVFATFTGNGLLKETMLYYLRQLEDVVDDIVVVGDCRVFPSELGRLPTKVRYCLFTHHAEYDFGSYKRGLSYVVRHPVLRTTKELVLCNDSCYGPIVPFRAMFERMADRRCDFWGVCENRYYKRHLQSYFLVFRERAWRAEAFRTFMSRIQKESSVLQVILKYEIGLTEWLTCQGFIGECCFRGAVSRSPYENPDEMNPTTKPLALLRQGCPLVKIKALRDCLCNLDGIEETLRCIERQNAELYQMIRKEIHQQEEEENKG